MAKKKTKKAARRPKRKNRTRSARGSISNDPAPAEPRVPTLASVMDDLKAIGDRASGLIV